MAARQFYYQESTPESTTTTTGTYQDKTTLTFTPDANSTYFIIGTWLIYSSSTTGSRRAFGQLQNTTSSTIYNNQKQQQNNTNGQRVGVGLGVDVFGASPASQTYKIQYVAEDALGTAKIAQARVIAIKKDSADQYQESTARSTNSTTSYVDKTTLTFTPASTGDYIIIAVADFDYSNNSTDQGTVTLDIDGTEYTAALHSGFSGTTANIWPWASLVKINLSNASHTIKIKYKSGGIASTIGIANARIIAIRADTLPNNYYAEQRVDQTTTNAAYQDELTLTQTPQAVNHLMLVAGIKANTNADAQGLEGSTSFGEVTDGSNLSTNKEMLFHLWSENLAASSTTWKAQLKSNGSATSHLDEIAIAVLQLDSGNVTTTQTIQALARITATTLQTILAKARVTATTLQTLLGKARIQITSSQTIQALARITATTSKTIQGLARITAITSQAILAKSDILKATIQTITGLAAIVNTSTQTILGKARVTATTIQTVLGKADILKSATQTITGLARIQIVTIRTIQGLARITATTTQTITGLARITTTTTRTIQGLARITITTTKTIQGLANIRIGGLKTILGLANILNTTIQTLFGQARIQITSSKTIQGLARVTIAATRTIQGLARIGLVTLKTIQGLARVTIQTSQTILGKANISTVTLKTISGLSNITQISATLRNIFGKANIAYTSNKTITGVTRIIANVEDIFAQPTTVAESGKTATILSSGSVILEEQKQNV